MGATAGDVRKVAKLVAVKTFLNEFVAYNGEYNYECSLYLVCKSLLPCW